MLKLENVNTYYGNSHVLFDVNLEVEQGEVVALLGRNGVGKTTTLRTIMGLTPASSGAISYLGKSIAGLQPFMIAQCGIGFVPEERWIFPNLTVEQNLLMGIKPGQFGKSERKGWSLEEAYESFPRLQERKNQPGEILSGGEKQMLTIVRTLMGGPDCVLIDEPSEGLAPVIVSQVTEIIKEINKAGATVLLVEQNLQMCLKLAHRIYVLSKGNVKWSGTPEELEARTDIRKKYLEV